MWIWRKLLLLYVGVSLDIFLFQQNVVAFHPNNDLFEWSGVSVASARIAAVDLSSGGHSIKPSTGSRRKGRPSIFHWKWRRQRTSLETIFQTHRLRRQTPTENWRHRQPQLGVAYTATCVCTRGTPACTPGVHTASPLPPARYSLVMIRYHFVYTISIRHWRNRDDIDVDIDIGL